jgi:hypothetical protein
MILWYFNDILNIYIDLNMLGLTSGSNMRGLNEFISDIRACKDKESEEKRVEV